MTYFEAMYSYNGGEIRDYFDAQGVHPGGSANPPDTHWPDNPSTADGWTDHPTFYFRHVEDVRELMERHDLGNHQIWITEYGWATPNSTPGFEFGNQVSLEEQAEFIVGAMRRAKEQYPWVGAMFLWNLNFATLRVRSEQASFSILSPNGNPRPSFLAIQRYLTTGARMTRLVKVRRQKRLKGKIGSAVPAVFPAVLGSHFSPLSSILDPPSSKFPRLTLPLGATV